MITKLFKSILKPQMSSLTLGDYDKVAEAIANAYDVANVGSSFTFFGASLLTGEAHRESWDEGALRLRYAQVFGWVHFPIEVT